MTILHLRPFLVSGLILAAITFCAAFPECIFLDPKDRSTFDLWSSCEGDQQMFAVKEYTVDLLDEPFDKESRFAFANTGSGKFCMESGFATANSENLDSDIVYKIESENPSGFKFILSVYDDVEEDVLSQIAFAEIGHWVREEAWLTSVENYRVNAVFRK